MLTNQMIGASHNANVHAPRPATAEPHAQAVAPTQSTDRPSTDLISARAIMPNTKPEQTETAFADRPPLQTPKRAEMRVAVVDSMPDAVPESIYKAKLSEPEVPDTQDPRDTA